MSQGLGSCLKEDVSAVITKQLINKHKVVYYHLISNIMSKTVSSLEIVLHLDFSK